RLPDALRSRYVRCGREVARCRCAQGACGRAAHGSLCSEGEGPDREPGDPRAVPGTVKVRLRPVHGPEAQGGILQSPAFAQGRADDGPDQAAAGSRIKCSNAPSAAAAPAPSEITICLNGTVVQSPAANTPGSEVCPRAS